MSVEDIGRVAPEVVMQMIGYCKLDQFQDATRAYLEEWGPHGGHEVMKIAKIADERWGTTDYTDAVKEATKKYYEDAAEALKEQMSEPDEE